MREFFRRANQKKYRSYFYGDTESTLSALQGALTRHYPRLPAHSPRHFDRSQRRRTGKSSSAFMRLAPTCSGLGSECQSRTSGFTNTSIGSMFRL
jgi:hypothetical protein